MAAKPDFDAGMNTLRALKPLTPPECSRYSVGPRSRIDWPQPYPLERPSDSARGVVIVFHDAGDRTLPSIKARSHASRSDGVDQMPPAAPIQPSPSGIDGSAAPRPSGV